MIARCGSCLYYAALNEECRLNPPSIQPLGMNNNQMLYGSFFPKLASDWWCSKFTPDRITHEGDKKHGA
jgi:hypothetical protein